VEQLGAGSGTEGLEALRSRRSSSSKVTRRTLVRRADSALRVCTLLVYVEPCPWIERVAGRLFEGRRGSSTWIERIVARLSSPGTQRARFPGGDRALATTSGRHHGQAIRIDSFEVDDSLILGPPPELVKGRRRILATPGRCTHKERCPRIERQGRSPGPLAQRTSIPDNLLRH
jgi:hypothetical protein